MTEIHSEKEQIAAFKKDLTAAIDAGLPDQQYRKADKMKQALTICEEILSKKEKHNHGF